MCLACASFECYLLVVAATLVFITPSPSFSSVSLSIFLWIFEMTGLLSVFSLLPVQTVKKREGSQEKAEDEEEQEGKRKSRGPVSPQEDGIERY